MSHARHIVGDTRDVLRTLPDASVDLVLTSPPFLALRSYLPADHPDKAKEIGSEATPGAFLDVLLDVVVELRRVLAPHGSLCVELGDTYSGSAGDNWHKSAPDPSKQRSRTDAVHATNGRDSAPVRVDWSEGWPLAKSLCMVPQSFAWALAYGRNPWTGREIEPWRVRNIVRWCRPNPPVGALGDKFRPATSEMVVACVGGSRYFDLDAVREPAAREGFTTRDSRFRGDVPQGEPLQPERVEIGASAPPLDYWVIPTHPYPGSHYATFPPELCVRPIKSMCPERVCRVCGKPSERITEQTAEYAEFRAASNANAKAKAGARANVARGRDGGEVADDTYSGWDNLSDAAARGVKTVTLGWTDCGHDDWRRGVVLDPFAGSGTTLEVATGHGRDAIGIDLDPRNADLAQQRVGMFLTVEAQEPAA